MHLNTNWAKVRSPGPCEIVVAPVFYTFKVPNGRRAPVGEENRSTLHKANGHASPGFAIFGPLSPLRSGSSCCRPGMPFTRAACRKLSIIRAGANVYHEKGRS